jgi:hypothetical protein
MNKTYPLLLSDIYHMESGTILNLPPHAQVYYNKIPVEWPPTLDGDTFTFRLQDNTKYDIAIGSDTIETDDGDDIFPNMTISIPIEPNDRVMFQQSNLKATGGKKKIKRRQSKRRKSRRTRKFSSYY